MKKYLAVVLVILFMVTTIVTGCSGGGTAPTTEEKKITELSLGHSGSTDHHYQEAALKFAEIVSQKTDGQIKVNIFPASQLGSGPDELESVKVGTQDLVISPDAFISSHEPLFNALGMPYQITSFEQVEKFPDSEAAKLLEEKIQDQNMVILGWCANGFRLMTANVPIEKPEDLKGLKMRAPAKLVSDLLLTLGSNPTSVAMAEAYTALQTGTIDGQENPTTNIMSHKLYEVQDHLSLTRHQYIFQPLVMNKEKFDNFSSEFQQILLEAGKEVAVADVAAVRNSEATQLEELKANGMIVTEPDIEAFKTALKPLYDQYSKANGTEWDKLINLIKEVK